MILVLDIFFNLSKVVFIDKLILLSLKLNSIFSLILLFNVTFISSTYMIFSKELMCSSTFEIEMFLIKN